MASMRSSTQRTKWKVGAFVAVAIATLVAACGNSAPGVEGTANNLLPDGTALACSSGHPEPGCPCAPDGATAQCGALAGKNGGYATCLEGTTTCTAGIWSACSGLTTTMFKSLGPLSFGGSDETPVRQPELLGMNSDAGDAGDAGQTPCTNNPCDPSCGTFVDNSGGVDGGPGLAPTDAGGWTLAGEGGAALDASSQCFVTLTGKVFDPAALEPVYNAVVAIPYTGNPIGSGLPPSISTGVPLLDACGGAAFPALRAAYTDTTGAFSLGGVPVQSTVSLVVQVGRWRRVVHVNTSACSCGTTIDISTANGSTCLGAIPTCDGAGAGYAGTASCLTHLPRTQGGALGADNVPHIAVATGGLDAIECMLYRMGVASSEFTDENGTGRIHVFNDGGSKLASPAANHDLSYLLGFACPGGLCPASNLTTNITNPGWDTGNLNGWTWGGAGWIWMIRGFYATQDYSVFLGLNDPYFGTGSGNSGTNTLTQGPFTAPAGVTGLAVDESEVCDAASGSYVQVQLHDNTSNTNQTCQNCNSDCNNNGCSWETCSLGVTAGHSYTLTLTSQDNSANGSGAAFDDVRWTPAPTVASLLNNYDMAVLPCDGSNEYDSNRWGYSYDDPGRTNLVNYANVGGRVFTSHWGREWIERAFAGTANSPFPNVATWIGDSEPCRNCSTWEVGDINTGSTWGANFNSWMTNVGAAVGGQFTIDPWRTDTSSVTSASRLFVSYDGQDGTTQGDPADFTFDTPLGGTALGRVMYTDMHLANGKPSGTFPGNCPAQGSTLLNQEAAAEYLLFDLGACVSGLPVPPNYPPISTSGNGTNSSCSGGTAHDVQCVSGNCSCSAVTGDPSGNSGCDMDFHCSASSSGTCTWSQQSGYYDPSCVTSTGQPGVDLTIGVPCVQQLTADGGTITAEDIPICNRGGGTLPAMTPIDIEVSGTSGNPNAPWVCTSNAAPKSGNNPATCTYVTPIALGPGECLNIDTTTAAGASCNTALNGGGGSSHGSRYLYVNYDKTITECGLGFTGTGAGCDNNTAHVKDDGGTCPPTCGGASTYPQSATFTRDFQGVCPAGYRVVWKWFSWSGVTPSDSSLDFQAWTADTQAQLGVQYPMPATLEQPQPDSHANGYTDNTLYGCQTCTDPTYVDVRLAAAGYPTSGSNPNPPPASFASHSWLRVNMILNASTNVQYAPTLLTWNQQYDCVPSE